MIIVARAIFLENSNYYPQVFLDECLCIKCKRVELI